MSFGGKLACAALLSIWGASTARARSDETVRKAMGDELGRSMKELKLGNEARPYYAAYQLTDSEDAQASATLGAVTSSNVSQTRLLRVDMRVGTPEMTGYSGFLLQPVLEDEYGALRRDLWIYSDLAYKRAQGALARKRGAEQRQAKRDDDPERDFSPLEPATVDRSEGAPPGTDEGALRTVVTRLSALFRDMPEVYGSRATAVSRVVRVRFLSSEGTWTDEWRTHVRIDVSAETQAPDGMRLDSYVPFFARTVAELPPMAAMEQATRQMASELVALRKAPVVESGNAVVLFERRAAGQVVRRLFADQAIGTPPGGELATRLQQRIAPAFLSISDDPTLATFGADPLFGAYAADDEGVPAERVSLVEKGVLKSLYMSRMPRKEIARSNGHGRYVAPSGNLVGRPGNVLVTGGKAGLSARALRDHAAKLARKAGTPLYVVRLAESRGSGRASMRGLSTFRVTSDKGKEKEELVRGVTLEGLSPKLLKEIAAVGKDVTVYHTGGQGMMDDPSMSVVTPALLFGDVEIRKDTGKHPKPPLYPRPSID